MKSISPLLATLLFGDAATASTVAQQITQASQWSALIKLSFDWRVTPQLWKRVETLGLELPDCDRKELASLCRIISINSTTAAHRSSQIFKALAEAGVPAIAFKGIGVMASLYNKPGDRMVGDVDILIAPESLEACFQALTPLGFEPVLPGELSHYLDYLHHRTRSDNLFLIFKDANGFEIDLHWGLKAIGGVDLSVPAILQRAVPATLLYQSIQVASPADAMLLSVHHSVRDDLAPESAIKDLCDLDAWWQCCDRWSLDQVIALAESTGLQTPLAALWQGLVTYKANHPAQAGLAVLKQNLSAQAQAQVQNLHRLFTLQLHGEAINRDLIHSLNWSTVKRFILRRLKQGSTLTFDQSLWNINHQKTTNFDKLRQLWQTLQGLDRHKLNAYKALSNLQDR